MAHVTMERSETDLLAAARRGERAALEALVTRYQPQVYRFGLKMCRDTQDAHEVLQDTLLTMARSLRDFRGDAAVSTWLYAIARSFCIKKLHSRQGARRREESLEAVSARQLSTLSAPTRNPEQELMDTELEAALEAAIASLAPSQREVLVLRDVEGLPAVEVAAILGLRVEAVKSRLHRARLAVRRQLALVRGTPAARERSVPCRDLVAHFSRHLEGDLDPRACARMEAHLGSCASCRDACESLKRTLGLCRRRPGDTVPEPIQAAVRDALRLFLDREASSRPSRTVRRPAR